MTVEDVQEPAAAAMSAMYSYDEGMKNNTHKCTHTQTHHTHTHAHRRTTHNTQTHKARQPEAQMYRRGAQCS